MTQSRRRRRPSPNQGLLRRDSMPIWTTSLLMRMIKQSHSLTSQTWGGKQTYASSRNITLTTESTVMGWKPNNLLRPNLNSKKIRKLKNLDQNLARNSKMLLRRLNLGIRSIHLLRTSQIVWFQILMTSETLMDLISPIHWEIKELVDHAIQCRSLKLLNLVLSSGMVRNSQFYHHNTSWHATISQRVVMEDGLSSMGISEKTDTWSRKNVLHTSPRQRAINVETTKTASQ